MLGGSAVILNAEILSFKVDFSQMRKDFRKVRQKPCGNVGGKAIQVDGIASAEALRWREQGGPCGRAD